MIVITNDMLIVIHFMTTNIQIIASEIQYGGSVVKTPVYMSIVFHFNDVRMQLYICKVIYLNK